MKKVNIPRPGQIVRCVEPWTVGIYRERENLIFSCYVNVDYISESIFLFTFPAGTEFKIWNYVFRKNDLNMQKVILRMHKTTDSRFLETLQLKTKTKTKVIPVEFSVKLGDFTDGKIEFDEGE